MKNIARLLLLTGLICQINLVHAAGFFVAEQSVSSLGTANAANTAAAEDATTTFSNPAGMAILPEGNNTVIGCFILVPSSHYHDKGTINAFGDPFPISSPSGNGGETAAIPDIAYVKNIWDGLAFGVSVNVPWGLTTEWDDDWYGRYYATHSEIKTLNINPAVAFKLGSCFSVGIGFNAMYIHTDLRNKVDFGLLLSNEMFPDAEPEGQDGKAKISGNTWAYGGNLGLLYQLGCHTRFGIHYRSQMRVNMNHGRIKFDFDDVPLDAIPILQESFVNTRARTKITIPDIVSFGAWHRFGDYLEVMADVQWTNWKTIQKLKIKFNKPANKPSALEGSTIPLHWNDSWRVAVGLKYYWTRCLALRAGYAYDQTPTPNDFYRTPRLPDEDRHWLACGFNYWISSCFQLDFAYAHIFFPTDAKIDKRPGLLEDSGITVAGGLYGQFHQSADIFGLSITSSF